MWAARWPPWSEQDLEGLADVIFVGEADETWPQFLRDWEQGSPQETLRAAAEDRRDDAAAAARRFAEDQQYMFGSMQISRGCPFTCEFCDIIVTFGRRPRLKTSEQVLAELESFRRAGLEDRLRR